MIWMPTPRPSVGEYRIRRSFAWWPVTLVTGARLWLERYYQIQRWEFVGQYDLALWNSAYAWRTVLLTTFDPSASLAALGSEKTNA